MDRNEIKKLKQQLAQMRRSPQKAKDIQSLAKSLGRSLFNRGKEPTWVSDVFPNVNPLSIPNHGAKDFRPGTQKSMLNQLEEDIAAWELKLKDDDEE
jgi:hypothetical protein